MSVKAGKTPNETESSGGNNKEKDGVKREKKPRAALYSENLPTFYCGSGNNSEL